MKIAILQTGKTNPAMSAKFRDYPTLFTGMFASDPRAAQHSFAPYRSSMAKCRSVDAYDAIYHRVKTRRL